MFSAASEIQLSMALVAAACAIAGVFLLLRRATMLTDAISHSVLPGIVLAYFAAGHIDSPWLPFGAALAGVAAVWLIQLTHQVGGIKQEAAIGIVFPALFALGVVLISRFAENVHLDVDAVLMGEPAFIPLDRVGVGAVSLPRALWTAAIALIVNALFVAFFYKELTIAAFDEQSAATLGLSPTLFHYLQMTVVSLTVVAAFDAMGSILVVALFVAPPAAAYLLSDRLSVIIWLAPMLAVLSSCVGYQSAAFFDVSIAGATAAATGLCLLLSAVMAPRRGLMATLLRARSRRLQWRLRMLLVHLWQHQDQRNDETVVTHLVEHLTWRPEQIQAAIAEALRLGLAEQRHDRLRLTAAGIEMAKGAVTA